MAAVQTEHAPEPPGPSAAAEECARAAVPGPSRPRVFAALVLASNALLLAGFAFELSLDAGRSAAGALAAGGLFAGWSVDVLLVAAAGALLTRRSLAARLAAYGLFAAEFLAGALQLAYHYVAGEFVSRLALANVNHVGLVLSPRRTVAAVLALAAGLAVPFVAERARRPEPGEARRLAPALLAAAAACALFAALLPAGARRVRDGILDANNLRGPSPLVSLAEVILPGRTGAPVAPTADDVRWARRFGFEIAPSAAWPLRRERIYDAPPPFPAAPGGPRRPNVVVFFADGVSARVTGPYGSPFPEITPNIDRFAAAARTMVVTNYYNHTAATYRGIHGQLCSMYPKDDASGWLEASSAGRGYSLAGYFRRQGYETTFLDAHRRAAGRVDEMAERLSFESVLGAEEMSARYLGGAAPLRADALSDHQLLDALSGFLAERGGRGAGAPEARPFFVTLYNLETHALQETGPDGVKYGASGVRPLDVLHNFDDAFGRFLGRFLASPLAEDTVVVLTADHCHYPTRSYVAALRPFGKDVPRVFVDAIPLIVYSPAQRLPKTFDAAYRTSIDFAPSLVHLLGLPQEPNAFLGRSLFEPRPPEATGPGVAAFGQDVFFVGPGGVARRGHLGAYARDFFRMQRLMRWFAQLEEDGRVWPPGP